MNVFQICSNDAGQELDSDDVTGGNMICATLEAARKACQQDEDEMVDECNELDDAGFAKAELSWTEDATTGRYTAESNVNEDLTYIIIRSKVFS